MKQNEWESSRLLWPMLNPFLESLSASAASRKGRLFCVAHLRANWGGLPETFRSAAKAGEMLADSPHLWHGFEEIFKPVWMVTYSSRAGDHFDAALEEVAHVMIGQTDRSMATRLRGLCLDSVVNPDVERGPGRFRSSQRSDQAHLCPAAREVFPGPDFPLANHLRRQRLLEWQGGLIAHMARDAYEKKDFGVFPFLADAVEDAEAGNWTRPLVMHLRGLRECFHCVCGTAIARPGEQGRWPCQECDGSGMLPLEIPHGRGCWALDFLAEKL